MRFTRARVRVFILTKLALILVIVYVVANSVQLKNFIIRNKKTSFSMPHKTNTETNSTLKILNYTKQLKSFSFKPALVRPKSYTTNGLGEFGVKVVLENLTKAEKLEESDLEQKYGINQFLSQKISLHRTLKDPRPPG